MTRKMLMAIPLIILLLIGAGALAQDNAQDTTLDTAATSESSGSGDVSSSTTASGEAGQGSSSSEAESSSAQTAEVTTSSSDTVTSGETATSEAGASSDTVQADQQSGSGQEVKKESTQTAESGSSATSTASGEQASSEAGASSGVQQDSSQSGTGNEVTEEATQEGKADSSATATAEGKEVNVEANAESAVVQDASLDATGKKIKEKVTQEGTATSAALVKEVDIAQNPESGLELFTPVTDASSLSLVMQTSDTNAQGTGIVLETTQDARAVSTSDNADAITEQSSLSLAKAQGDGSLIVEKTTQTAEATAEGENAQSSATQDSGQGALLVGSDGQVIQPITQTAMADIIQQDAANLVIVKDDNNQIVQWIDQTGSGTVSVAQDATNTAYIYGNYNDVLQYIKQYADAASMSQTALNIAYVADGTVGNIVRQIFIQIARDGAESEQTGGNMIVAIHTDEPVEVPRPTGGITVAITGGSSGEGINAKASPVMPKIERPKVIVTEIGAAQDKVEIFSLELKRVNLSNWTLAWNGNEIGKFPMGSYIDPGELIIVDTRPMRGYWFPVACDMSENLMCNVVEKQVFNTTANATETVRQWRIEGFSRLRLKNAASIPQIIDSVSVRTSQKLGMTSDPTMSYQLRKNKWSWKPQTLGH